MIREEDLVRVGAPWLFGQVEHLFGPDIRSRIPHPPPAGYVARLVHEAAGLVARGRSGGAGPVVLPVTTTDPWCGYVTGPAGRPTTRRLVAVAFRCAVGTVGIRSGVPLIPGKGVAAAARYETLIGDGRGRLLAAAYTRCRADWGYTVPADPAAWPALRRLCEGVFEFEAEFLAEYAAFVVAERQSADPDRRATAERWGDAVRGAE